MKFHFALNEDLAITHVASLRKFQISQIASLRISFRKETLCLKIPNPNLLIWDDCSHFKLIINDDIFKISSSHTVPLPEKRFSSKLSKKIALPQTFARIFGIRKLNKKTISFVAPLAGGKITAYQKSARTMILAPSDIHFLQDTNNGLLTPDEGTMADLSCRFLQGHERIPKVQVTEKNGFWFALNNSYLHIIKDLEKQGKCAKIRVEVVPLSRVPETLQKGMIVEGDKLRQKADDKLCYRLNHGYCRIPPTCLATSAHLANFDEDTDDTSSYTSSDYSDYDNDEDDDDVSGSEYDDDLSCNVCDRSFNSTRLLAQHQQKKRHFGCSVCNSCFPSLHALEHHKESLDHWSEDEGNTYESDSCCDESDEDKVPVAPSADQKEQLPKTEEMERLL